MIRKMSHTSVYVLNQDEALKFYTEKLGFEVRSDMAFEGGRWVTVGPKNQQDLEIVLMPVQPGGMFDDAVVEHLQALLSHGAMGGGVFETNDCQATYDELSGKGVEFLSPPQQRPYGVEAVFRDNSGNWFSLTQHG